MAAALIAAIPVPAAAQATASGGSAASAAPRMEVEAYGGLGRFPDAGASPLSLPAAGAPITTSSPFSPSRRVSSWFFGDGASLINAVSQQLDLAPRVVPLDAAIATIGRGAESRASLGVRLRVRTAPHVWAEAAVDLSSGSSHVPDSLATDVEATRASFVASMTSLFASGPFSGTVVTATATPAAGSWRELTTSLAANVEMGAIAGVTPYVTIGGGVVTRMGTGAAMSLAGHYTTTILGSVPIDETDRVTIRAAANTAPAIVAGAGLSRTIADRLSLRLDARVIAANRTISANIDPAPSVTDGTPSGFIESFTNPSVQFSNSPATGRRSSLSGDALDHLAVDSSTRLQVRGLVTLGIAVRF